MNRTGGEAPATPTAPLPQEDPALAVEVIVGFIRSQMEQTYVRAPKGFIIVNACGPEAVLVVLVAREAKLGLIFLELKRTVAELEKQL